MFPVPKGVKAIQQKTATVRRESRPVPRTPNDPRSQHPSPASQQRNGHVRSPQVSSIVSQPGGGAAKVVKKSRASAIRQTQKRKSASPALPQFSSDSEGGLDEDDGDSGTPARKKTRTTPGFEPDHTRRIRDVKNWSEANSESVFDVVHGKDLTTGKADKFRPLFEDIQEISLQYPSASQKEKFQLVLPKESDGYRPIEDIEETIVQILTEYIPTPTKETLLDPSNGIPYRLRRAVRQLDLVAYRSTVQEFNSIISEARSDGTITKQLDDLNRLQLPLIERILAQTYARTVSPRVESLRRYENGTDNVYGELLPKFISQIFRDTKLRSDMVFLDLGSGVGNVVLQAALEIGCESHGIEMMANPCELAIKQAAEFPARCRMWGIAPGEVNLLKGDFLEDPRVNPILRRADVVLVNNQAFQPDLNEALTSLFLDVKDGARIVSLKSFVPSGWKLTERTSSSVLGLLDVKRREYWTGSVSWTDIGGEYFVATKDSKRLERFARKRTG